MSCCAAPSAPSAHARTPPGGPRCCARPCPLTPAVARRCGSSANSVEQCCALIERSERLKLYVYATAATPCALALMLERLTGLYSQGETPHLPL